jgi:hypothetical protein
MCNHSTIKLYNVCDTRSILDRRFLLRVLPYDTYIHALYHFYSYKR